MYKATILIIFLAIIPMAIYAINFDLYTNLEFMYFFSSNYSGNITEPYENWELNFQPPNSSMEIEEMNNYNNFSFGIDLCPAIDLGILSLGINVGYTFEGPIAGNQLAWWNPVWINTISLIRTTPSFGIVAFLDLKSSDYFEKIIGISMQLEFQRYKLFNIYYEGVDVPGNTNYEKQISRDLIDSGTLITSQITINYEILFIGFIYEWNEYKYYNKTLGLIAGVSFNLFNEGFWINP